MPSTIFISSPLTFFIRRYTFHEPVLLIRILLFCSLIFMARDKARSRRFGEPAKFLPVIFVIAVIATVYGIYTYVCTQLHSGSISLTGSPFPFNPS